MDVALVRSTTGTIPNPNSWIPFDSSLDLPIVWASKAQRISLGALFTLILAFVLQARHFRFKPEYNLQIDLAWG